MRTATLGPLGAVSRLTLGGGIGQIWGETTHEEALATVHAAVDAGVTLIDCAPMYRNAEAFVGEAFGGRPPAGVRFTTKCQLGSPAPGQAGDILAASLESSLQAMRLERMDVFFLHSNIHVDGFEYAHGGASRDRFSTALSIYLHEVVPAMERLKAQGKLAAWGITGIGVPTAVLEAIDHAPRPQVVQAIANLMDSPGALKRYAEPARPRDVAAAAKAAGCGVMGIRAVQAGALTAAVDRELSPNSPDRADYDRAAPFRALCAKWGQDPAYAAHRYALSMPNIDTVVLGVKNRDELAMCVKAEADGPYSAEEMAEIDGLGLAPA
ncbi:MAG: aldo/keto reductase [Phenylobacterium sp.]|uniref:aldo/keto reductase n=1 Tax=Phenylobacterium sp. TaxID=1871053 RepID=UPI0025D4ED12|nr:aldo/keto reductase [Phenylobacterium sp.]MBI1199141.1 aldo/keto reductase [Phenylobacterium sp.]